MKYLSLFSGIGGMELGIQQAYESNTKRKHIGKESESEECPQGRVGSADKRDEIVLPTDGTAPLCIGYSEIDRYAIQVYENHFLNHKNYGDITKINAIELPDFDFLCGGFPCQAFSIAVLRRGFDDTRGTLFFDIARILREKQPRLFLLENVKGLLSHDSGRTFKTIVAALTELGYDIQWQVLNSKNFGVPQNRERVFIVGHLRGTPRPEVFPFRHDGGEIDELSRHVSNTLTARYEGAQATGTYIGEGELDAQEAREQSILEDRFISDNNDSNRRKTHSSDIRRLTPTECERLQGFPDNWTEGISDSQRYKCCGNAVTVNVIKSIMEKLYA